MVVVLVLLDKIINIIDTSDLGGSRFFLCSFWNEGGFLGVEEWCQKGGGLGFVV